MCILDKKNTQRRAYSYLEVLSLFTAVSEILFSESSFMLFSLDKSCHPSTVSGPVLGTLFLVKGYPQMILKYRFCDCGVSTNILTNFSDLVSAAPAGLSWIITKPHPHLRWNQLTFQRLREQIHILKFDQHIHIWMYRTGIIQ